MNRKHFPIVTAGAAISGIAVAVGLLAGPASSENAIPVTSTPSTAVVATPVVAAEPSVVPRASATSALESTTTAAPTPKRAALPKIFAVDLHKGTANGWQMSNDGWKLSGWQCISDDCQRMAFAAAKGNDNYLIVGDSYDNQATFEVVSSLPVDLAANQVLLGGHIYNPNDCNTTYAGIHQGPNADVIKAWKIDDRKFVPQAADSLVVMDECGA